MSHLYKYLWILVVSRLDSADRVTETLVLSSIDAADGLREFYSIHLPMEVSGLYDDYFLFFLYQGKIWNSALK
jgi:hypothetical protein